MKYWLVLPFALFLSSLTALVYILDQCLGIVAYNLPYFLFCSIVALVFGSAWFATIKKHSILAGFVAFLILASLYVLPPPSERLLRSTMLKIPPGTDADAIEAVVNEEYLGSAYVLPRIYRDIAGNKERIHVSLLSQESGNCTSLIFILEDGLVVRRIFSPD